jgi:AbrB family looped-hinge helix DNA binding protein
MSESEKRKVGQRGQVTLPKELRDRFGIHGGDAVLVHEEGGKIVIEKPATREELTEGYRRHAKRTQKLTEEMDGVSQEANEYIGDAPDW